MLSLQSASPSSGATNLMSGLSNCSWMMSPDHASQATTLPLTRSWAYSLPVNARIWPASVAFWSRSIASPNSSSVKSSGSAPSSSSMNSIVSCISESRLTLPLRSGRVSSSSKLRTSLVSLAL